MGQAESNESAAVKRQAEGFSNPMYRMLDLGGGGLFMELGKRAMLTNNTMELDEAIRSKIKPYLYNGGEGKWIHCAHLACLRNRDRPKSKQFPEITVSSKILVVIVVIVDKVELEFYPNS